VKLTKDKLWEQPVFTVEDAAKVCQVSQRTMYDWIKTGFIKCIPHTSDITKREKKLIARGELERRGFLSPLKVEIAKLSAKEILEHREMEAHINEIYKLKEKLKSELWLPPLSYLPPRDLSVHSDTYFRKHSVNWTDGEDGFPIIRLSVEGEDNFICLRQHTEDSEFWQHLLEWKQLGGNYIYNRSILLKDLQEDIQTDERLSTVVSDTKSCVLEGFSWAIFRHLFPQTRPDEKRAKQLTEKAISLANKGSWKEASNANRSIIKMFPADINALKRLGKALMELKQYISAKEAYSRALEVDPSDSIARKMLRDLLQKHPDDSGIAGVDGGRYRVVSRESDLWFLAVFTDDRGETIASVCPTKIDLTITAFQNLLHKYMSYSKIDTILESRREIDELERTLLRELKAITLKTLTDIECDRCPV
jgi:tetratricopeptide (TPR) repeat protein